MPIPFVKRLRAAMRAASAAFAVPATPAAAAVAVPAHEPAAAPGSEPARQRRRTSGALQLLRLFENSDSGLLACDRSGRVLMCSPHAAAMLGAEAVQVCQHPISDWLTLLAGDASAPMFENGQWETTARRLDGSTFAVELTVSEARLDQVSQYILIVRDITDRKLTQQRLMFLANFDSLTGLPNRVLFRDRLTQAMARAERSARPMALMFLDLDRFKVINDSLGHEVGDQLLRHVAEALQLCLRQSDSVTRVGVDESYTVSRLGGDEFTVIAENLGGPDDAALIARRILEALESPFQLLGTELHVSCSIGISMFPGDDTDLDGLIRHTDMAMYRSKAIGGATYSFYSGELSAEVAARLMLENDLRRAVEREEFVLHYQPQAELGSGRIAGIEALMRWHPPGRGIVGPDRFIHVLEDSGLILPAGAWVVRTACRELAAMDRAGMPKLTLAVNLSARQFRQPLLAHQVADALADAGVDPSRLEIELTESLVMEDSQASRKVLEELAAMGVRVAIDDFGTGHSSLSYLKRFDIDTLKIDRSFVSELPHSAEDCAIATAIVAMGHSLHMKIVAEGVETVEQAAWLRGAGCDEVQGYLIGRPMPAAQFQAWMQRYGADAAGRGFAPSAADSAPAALLTLDAFEPAADA